jgi:hypothetical protein
MPPDVQQETLRLGCFRGGSENCLLFGLQDGKHASVRSIGVMTIAGGDSRRGRIAVATRICVMTSRDLRSEARRSTDSLTTNRDHDIVSSRKGKGPGRIVPSYGRVAIGCEIPGLHCGSEFNRLFSHQIVAREAGKLQDCPSCGWLLAQDDFFSIGFWQIRQ